MYLIQLLNQDQWVIADGWLCQLTSDKPKATKFKSQKKAIEWIEKSAIKNQICLFELEKI